MIAAIAAISNNNIIGKNGVIPWKIRGEQEYFKELTMYNIVIMGRKSYEEIGHPLPNRIMIIVTSQDIDYGNGIITAHSVKEAISIAEDIKEKYDNTLNIYIAGGGQIYKEAIDFCDVLYLTIIDLIIDEDDTCIYFPKFDASKYDICKEQSHNGKIKYARYVYTKKEN